MSESKENSRVSIFGFLFLIGSLFYLTICFLLPVINPNDTIISCIAILVCSVGILFAGSAWESRFWFRGYVVVAFYAMAHHLITATAFILGIKSVVEEEKFSLFATEVGVSTIILITIGVVSILLGGTIASLVPSGRHYRDRWHGDSFLSAKAFVRSGNVAVWVAITLFVVANILNGGSWYLERNLLRIKTLGATWPDRFLAFSNVAIMASLTWIAIASVTAHGRLFPTIIQWLVLFLFSLSVLLRGERDDLLIFVIMLATIYVNLVRPIPLRWLVVATLLVFIVSQIVVIGRAKPNVSMYKGIYQQVVGEGGYSKFRDMTINDHIGKIIRMAHQPFLNVANTVDSVGKSMPPVLGKEYAVALVHSLPRGSILNLTSHQELYNGWLTKNFDPDTYKIGGGLGGSIFGDAYFNFLLPGVILTSGIFGFLGAMTTIVMRQYGRSILYKAIMCSLLYSTLVFVRNDFVNFMRTAYYFSFTFFGCWILGKYIQRHIRNTSL